MTLGPRSKEIEASPPAQDTIEAWAWHYVHETRLSAKLAPVAPPNPESADAWEKDPPVRRLRGPGRPPELSVVVRGQTAPRPGALREPAARARLLHTFIHHELQAAELFAWAILAFPDTPPTFRAGLLRLCQEELRHLHLYRTHLEQLGAHYGDWPVRDWFWQRVPSCNDAVAFVALQGVGLEGANLEHSARYREHFAAAGDHAGAAILARVEREEIQHVAFAVRWFEELSGRPLRYEAWREKLPAPLTPALLQGRPLNHAARRRAGLSEDFLRCLASEPPTSVRRSS